MDTSSQRLEILHTVARKLSTSVHLEQMLTITLSQVARLLALETGWIFLLDGDDRFQLAAAQNLPPGLAAAPERLTGWCQCQDMFRHDALHRGQNISIVACSRLNQLSPDQTGGLKFHASIPLVAGEQKLGVLNAASRQKQALAQDELHTLYTIGDLLALGIQRARYYEEHLALSALDERFRLARELHDTLGQGLAALILRLETLDALVDKGLPTAQLKAQLAASAELARGTLRQARSSVQSLRSRESALPPLTQAIPALLAEMFGQLPCELSLTGAERLSPAMQQSVYRMLQELITNVHKHAAANRLEVMLAADAQGVTLRVQDNGRGFDPAAVPPGHFGLLGLRERVHLLQGELRLHTAPGQGTEIVILLPGDQT